MENKNGWQKNKIKTKCSIFKCSEMAGENCTIGQKCL